MRYGSNRGINNKIIPFRCSRCKSPVDFYQFASSQSRADMRTRPCGKCEQHYPRSSPPKAMNRNGGRVVFPHQRKKRVFEETATGNCRESTGFGHGKQVFIFMENRPGQGHLRFIPGRTTPDEPLSVSQNTFRPGGPSVYKNLAPIQALPPLGHRGVAITPGKVSQDAQTATPIIYLLAILESTI